MRKNGLPLLPPNFSLHARIAFLVQRVDPGAGGHKKAKRQCAIDRRQRRKPSAEIVRASVNFFHVNLKGERHPVLASKQMWSFPLS